jgi:uncharacterized protein YqeY
MSLVSNIMDELKPPWESKKDTVALKFKSFQIELFNESKEETQKKKCLQRLVKTRKESARIFTEQNRLDLAEPELSKGNATH